MNCVKVVNILFAELVDQRAEQARPGLPQLAHQIPPAAGALDGLARIDEDPLDLFVKFVAVGDDHHSGVGVVFKNPLCQQHHYDAFSAALRVPDDAALMVTHVPLRRLDGEILVHARQLFHAAIEEHEIVHQLDQPFLVAHLEQILVQLEAGVILLVFLPLQEILLLRTNAAVLKPFGIVASEDELHGAEKPPLNSGC